MNDELEVVARRLMAKIWKKARVMQLYISNFTGDPRCEILYLENDAHFYVLGDTNSSK